MASSGFPFLPTGSKDGTTVTVVVVSQDRKLEELKKLAQKTHGCSDMHKPTVTIVVNNYNYGQFLPEAIDSTLNQTHPNTEIVVVDDGSTDNSQEVIASYSTKIIPVLKKNGGQASALNAGFTVSRGEIVIFLDADDYLFPDTVEQVVAAWKQDVAKVQYLLEIIDAHGRRIGTHPPLIRPLDSGQVWHTLLEKGRYETPVTSGNAFRRAVLDEILPIPEAEFQIAADGYLMTLVPFYGNVVSIEKVLGAYRIHGSNLWALNKKVEVERLSKFVQHDLQRYELLRGKATELGYKLSKDLSCRDYLHLRNRIASLSLGSRNHPVPSDSRLFLTYRGVWAMWRYSELNWKKRLLFSMWFVWVGLVPLFMVEPAISWLLIPHSRPRSLEQVGNLLERACAVRKLSP